MAKEIAVYKLQEWDMGEGEKKYSPLGILEATIILQKLMEVSFCLQHQSICLAKKESLMYY